MTLISLVPLCVLHGFGGHSIVENELADFLFVGATRQKVVEQRILQVTAGTSNIFELPQSLLPEAVGPLSCIGTLLQEVVVDSAPNVTCVKDDLALRHAILVHRIQSLQAVLKYSLGAPVLLRWALERHIWVSEGHVLELKPVDGVISTIVVIEASRWSMLLVRQCKDGRGMLNGVILFQVNLVLVKLLEV